MKDTNSLLLEGLASCHAITFVHGQLIGDPLDVQMFKSTNWQLDESQSQKFETEQVMVAQVHPKTDDETPPGYRNAIVRRYDFTSQLMRMSVICKNNLHGEYRVYVKGSPEKLLSLCLPNTIPANFNFTLENYTKEGFRVVALATKTLGTDVTYQSAQTLDRSQVETGLQFLGFLVMENKLKPETIGVIKNLNECNVRTVMATGDNLLTAMHVARQCAILTHEQVWLGEASEDNQSVVWKHFKESIDDEIATESLNPENGHLSLRQMSGCFLPWRYTDDVGIALTGAAFRILMKTKDTNAYAFKAVVSKASVFARMSPDDKADLVTSIKDVLQIEVGMCGDGANDCGALKAASVGISLSEAEASIAAPFTS